MSSIHPGFRIFVLGAGFSRSAGLPLAPELLGEVRREIEGRYGRDTKFQRDVENYVEYRTACDGHPCVEASIDLEEFMSFLDIEHYLGLRGSDTWSAEGNESQIMVRKAIGKVIHDRTPSADRLPDAYYEFAERLSLHDIVITLNYDILLERALDHIGKPYRLFPTRFKNVGRYLNETDPDTEEVVILKLHGSVDWFNDKEFLEIKASQNQGGTSGLSIHSVFDDPTRYGAQPIVNGLRSPDDPLKHVHRIQDVDGYYQRDTGFNAPFILSPSHVKFVYAEPLLSFWRGLGRAGGYNLGISVIGFSLPPHDEYLRVALFQIISNYQQSEWNSEILGCFKDDVKLIDFRTDDPSIAAYKKSYGFVDDSKAQYRFNGFGQDAIKLLFDEHRTASVAKK
jgi:hypothetical protein